MSEPAVSIVVPTYRRGSLLARLVAALESQRDAPPFEVIVVDDASPDGSGETLEKLAADASIPVRPIRLRTNGGPARARNTGWWAATAPIVAFTDDDCVPQPGWVAALVAPFGSGADLVQGRTAPHPGQLDRRGPFSRTIDVDHEAGFYETCNMAYRRELLERLGGFDEQFRYPHGEDTDLAWRALDAGARPAFAHDAVVWHDVTPSRFVDRLRDARRKEGTVLAVRRHPALRDRFEQRWFYRPSHVPALVSLAGALVAARNPRSPLHLAVGAALQVPYANYRYRGYEPINCRRRELPAYIPAFLVADLLDIAVLARASVRYRTLLL